MSVLRYSRSDLSSFYFIVVLIGASISALITILDPESGGINTFSQFLLFGLTIPMVTLGWVLRVLKKWRNIGKEHEGTSL